MTAGYNVFPEPEGETDTSHSLRVPMPTYRNIVRLCGHASMRRTYIRRHDAEPIEVVPRWLDALSCCILSLHRGLTIMPSLALARHRQAHVLHFWQLRAEHLSGQHNAAADGGKGAQAYQPRRPYLDISTPPSAAACSTRAQVRRVAERGLICPRSKAERVLACCPARRAVPAAAR